MLLAAGGVLALNGHYFVGALLALLGVPVSIGHFVAFGLIIDYAHTQYSVLMAWTDLDHICDLKRRQLVDTTETGGTIGPFVREQAGTR
jgi:hypothetical protein